MAKKKSVEWVRLSNGAIENKEGVGAIMLVLRTLALNHPSEFELLAQWVAEVPDKALTPALAGKLASMKFLDSAAEEPVLYDDVKDVIECCAQWSGNKVRFSSDSLLHVDQTGIVPPE